MTLDTFTLDASCPAAAYLPYLLNFNASAAEHWAEDELNDFGSTLPTAIALTVGSVLLLFFGERLTKLTLFLCAALISFVVSMFTTDAILSAAKASQTVGCVSLITVPILFGLLGGALALKLLALAFACAGFAAGAAFGQFLYVLFLFHVSTGVTVLGHDLFYFLTLLFFAIPCAILMEKYRETFMIYATAALGAVGLVPGLAILLLSHIDSRFLWVTDPSDANAHRGSPFVYGQALAVLLYFPIGVAVQRKLTRKKPIISDASQPYLIYQEGRGGGRRNILVAAP